MEARPAEGVDGRAAVAGQNREAVEVGPSPEEEGVEVQTFRGDVDVDQDVKVAWNRGNWVLCPRCPQVANSGDSFTCARSLATCSRDALQCDVA